MYTSQVSIIKVGDESVIVNENMITESDRHLFEVAGLELEEKQITSKLTFGELKQYFPDKIEVEIEDFERDISVVSEKAVQLKELETKYLESKSKIESDIQVVTQDYGAGFENNKTFLADRIGEFLPKSESFESKNFEHNNMVPMLTLDKMSDFPKEFFGNKQLKETESGKIDFLSNDTQDPYSKYALEDFSTFKNKFFVTYNTIFEFCVVMDFKTFAEGFEYHNIDKLGFLPFEEVELLENSDELLKLNGQQFSKKMFDIRLNFIKEISNSDEENTSTTVANIIKSKYYITEDEQDRVKAKTIMEAIKSCSSEKISFNTLSRILMNMGLKRKRFSDGNYYYGLVLKQEIDPNRAHEIIVNERRELNQKQTEEASKKFQKLTQRVQPGKWIYPVSTSQKPINKPPSNEIANIFKQNSFLQKIKKGHKGQSIGGSKYLFGLHYFNDVPVEWYWFPHGGGNGRSFIIDSVEKQSLEQYFSKKINKKSGKTFQKLKIPKIP